MEIPPLADEYLKPEHFSIIGMWPRMSWLSNRRSQDLQVSEFLLASGEEISDANWGLPVPNLPAAYKSLGKYNQVQPQVNEASWCKAYEFLVREFYPHMCESRIVSQEEAIDTLDKSTSVGFPYNLDYKDKRAWLAEPAHHLETSDDWEKMPRDDYVCIFSNSVKEEIKLRTKIEENKLRTFTAIPVIGSIQGTRLCLDQNEKFYGSAMLTSSTVGKDVFHRGWDDCYRKLKRFLQGYELDVSSMDAVVNQLTMGAIQQFRINCWRESDRTPENIARMRSLYRNLVWTIIILADGLIVRKKTGNPSGSTNTIVDNSLGLFLWLSYAWVELAPPHLQNYESFKAHVELLITGDDNTWSSSDDALQFFSVANIAKVFATLGVSVSSPSMEPRPIEQLTYLSRRFDVFVNDPMGRSVCVPVLDREKMLVSLVWSEKPADPTYSLLRAIGIYQVTWADGEMRRFLKRYISWLIREFGPVLQSDGDWNRALKGFKPDDFMLQLYTCRVAGPGKSIGYKVQEKET